MSGVIPPISNVRSWRRAYLSTGTQLFYAEMATELLQRSENLYNLDQNRKKNSAISFIFQVDICEHGEIMNLEGYTWQALILLVDVKETWNWSFAALHCNQSNVRTKVNFSK